MDKLLVLTLTALIVLPRPVLASDGNLDTSFGNGGRVSSRSESANATAIQPDGKIVVAGSVLTQVRGRRILRSFDITPMVRWTQPSAFEVE